MRTMLFHKTCRKGRVFEHDDKDFKKHGWVDTPAKLPDLPKEAVKISAAEVRDMSPEGLIKKVESMGFIVMTQEQLDAKINQALSGNKKSKK